MEKREHFLKEQRKEYMDILTGDILPYWLGKTDRENGGFYTCYDVMGKRLMSRDKYVWSQGRCVWLYSRLAMDQGIALTGEVRKQCGKLASEGSRFLRNHCILPDGRAAFVLDEKNQAKKTGLHDSRAASTFADCFVAMGLAAAAQLEQDKESAETAFHMMANAARLLKDGAFQTAPDVLPKGWKSQASYMIMVNTSYETAKALDFFGMTRELETAKDICRYAVKAEVEHFIKGNLLLECLDGEFQPVNTLYGRHINPGHTLECMWFLIEAARWLQMDGVEEKALNVIKHVSDMAWDSRFGGMYYYLDKDGGEPIGEFFEEERELAEAALRDWSNKMWWPQLETIYANLTAYFYYGDEACLKEYERYRDYAFRVFPNPDPLVGEWIQIRDREGKPLCQEVGGRLPVKDPYHLMRTLILLIGLIGENMR